jgi:predicted flap endonuclease-1-like 5' DNA nuclease
MTTEESVRFEELTKLATEFVTMRKGLWDHAAWTDFVSSLKKRGFDISEDMQANLGELVEAMKRFYTAAGSTESMEKAMRAIMDDSVAFVKSHKGVWGHSEWEEFLETMQRNTLNFTEGTAAYLGGVLESTKVFYSLSPTPSAPKTAPPPPQKPSPASTSALAPKQKAETKPTEPKVEEKPPAKKADKPDDLTAIAGIGPALAKKLNAAGIQSYAQIASLSDKDIEQLEKKIKSAGRVKRGDWVGQAKKLSRG